MSRNITVKLDINKINKKISFEAFEGEDINLIIALFDGKESYYLDNVNVELKCCFLNKEVNIISNLKYDMNEILANLKFNEYGIIELQLNISSNKGVLITPLFFGHIRKSLIGTNVYSLVDSEGYSLIDSEGNRLKVRG